MITCYFENGNKVGLRHIVVSAIIVKDSKVLLCKRGTYNGKPILEHGKWGLIGGYFDRDEILVEAVKRETLEETGYRLDDIKLFRINDSPNRTKEDRQNMDMIFTARAVSQVPVQTEEVTELKWFDLDNLPSKEQIAFDFFDSLELYKKFLKKKFPLPVLEGV
jgi:8-oxo-dGTP diphosphatase